MSEMQFENQEQPEIRLTQTKPNFDEKLANLIIKLSGGMVESRTGVTLVILSGVAIIMIVSLFIFFNSGPKHSSLPTSNLVPGQAR